MSKRLDRILGAIRALRSEVNVLRDPSARLPSSSRWVAVIGAGPAGLMAAEALSRQGVPVEAFDAMPSVGRKFLMAGKGGLNLTHSEPFETFLTRYGPRRAVLEPLLRAFGPEHLRRWARGLGLETFVGTSRRVFPLDLKAGPLLRAWLRRLRETGVTFHVRHRWVAWAGERDLSLETPLGLRSIRPGAVVLALGGASWPRLGSDAAWVPLLEERGLRIAPLRPSNCGFDIGWSDHFRERFAGHPLKSVAATFRGRRQLGEFVITATGAEGSLVYSFSPGLRDEIDRAGVAVLSVDLTPDKDHKRLVAELSRPRGSRSLASHLSRRAGIRGVKAGLLREHLSIGELSDPARLARAIKALPLRLVATRPIEEAISSAGGVTFDELDPRLMLRSCPGVFCAGEMLDWEAPTGGYLLTACFSTGRAAGLGASAWLRER